MQPVTSRRSRAPNRQATRKAPAGQRVRPGGSAHPSGGGVGDGAHSEVVLGDEVDIAEPLVATARTAIGAVGRARGPLAAEMALAELFGAVEQAAPTDATAEERAAVRSELLDALIGWAVSDASPAALAFLRVAAVLGDASTRGPAATAAERLAAAGVVDRRWAPVVGRPHLLRAWWYGDVFGNQASVNLLFDYHREHCLSVLIDHGLGGGVKDCWIAEGQAAAGMRDRTAAEFAANPTAEFADIDAQHALDLLQAAVDQPTCPEQDDQIQDVAAYFEIVQSRIRLLAAEADRPDAVAPDGR